MIRFILNSFTPFIFGIVTPNTPSKDFGVVMSNKDFKTKNSLLAVCSQQDGQDSSDGYHLKTNLPSFNPDQNVVEKVSCKAGANSITFSLKDKKVVEGDSTQFFTATDEIIDESKLSATFAIMRCDCPYNSEDYDLNINWSKVQLLFNGNFLMNVDFAFEASKEKDMLNLGPSIDLVAATDATLEATGTFEFGDDLSLGRSNLIVCLTSRLFEKFEGLNKLNVINLWKI
ncbi:unnamed protein product [Rhizophagus irregularis]|nr:unnamed protein product [Rhizophagus irregularis]